MALEKRPRGSVSLPYMGSMTSPFPYVHVIDTPPKHLSPHHIWGLYTPLWILDLPTKSRSHLPNTDSVTSTFPYMDLNDTARFSIKGIRDLSTISPFLISKYRPIMCTFPSMDPVARLCFHIWTLKTRPHRSFMYTFGHNLRSHLWPSRHSESKFSNVYIDLKDTPTFSCFGV